MASIVGFNVTINTACDAGNKSCHLAYMYNVLWDDNDTNKDEEYTMTAQMWGGASYSHYQIFADPDYDAHKITRATTMPVIRKIAVKCDMLDNFWSEDVFLKLVMIPDSNPDLRFEALSTTQMEEQMATPSMEKENRPTAAAA